MLNQKRVTVSTKSSYIPNICQFTPGSLKKPYYKVEPKFPFGNKRTGSAWVVFERRFELTPEKL
jgi:hypothetical protein